MDDGLVGTEADSHSTPAKPATATRAVGVPVDVTERPARSNPGRRLRLEALASPLSLLPSIVAVGIFVYGFISFTLWVSVSNWRKLKRDMSLREPIYANYTDLFTKPRFQADLRNVVIFTVFFLVLAIVVGLSAAILLDQRVKGRRFFRNAILFPYALSFVVTGVIWRWLFNPETGVNLLFNVTGLNRLLETFGVGPLRPGWTTDPSVWLKVNDVVERVLPFGDKIQIGLGIPAALVPVAIAAAWQLSGFVMAMYLGGMASIPLSVQEAARIDGASEWQIYRRVVIPMLKPITITVIVILLHTSLKTFDLVVALSGSGPGFATDLPSLFVFDTMFKATQYNSGTAAAIVILLASVLVIVPYLVRASRSSA